MEPILFVFTGPSGAGKGSIMRALLEADSMLHKVVTYTTREPRPGEIQGFDYNFVSATEFQRMIKEGHVFEYEKVYQDHYYGSPRELFVTGSDSIVELDYKGRLKYQERHRGVVSLFVLPPTLEELRRRILRRSEVENLDARLQNAIDQLRHARTYDYIVQNDSLQECVKTVQTIITAERQRRKGLDDLRTMTHALIDTH